MLSSECFCVEKNFLRGLNVDRICFLLIWCWLPAPWPLQRWLPSCGSANSPRPRASRELRRVSPLRVQPALCCCPTKSPSRTSLQSKQVMQLKEEGEALDGKSTPGPPRPSGPTLVSSTSRARSRRRPQRTSSKPIKNPWQHTFDSHRRAGQVASSGLDSQIGPLLRFEDDDLALHANPSEADRRAPEHRPARSCRPIAAPRSHARPACSEPRPSHCSTLARSTLHASACAPRNPKPRHLPLPPSHALALTSSLCIHLKTAPQGHSSPLAPLLRPPPLFSLLLPPRRFDRRYPPVQPRVPSYVASQVLSRKVHLLRKLLSTGASTSPRPKLVADVPAFCG